MTPLCWAGLTFLAAAAAVAGACWWGADVVFNPGHKSPVGVFPGQFGLAHEDVEIETPDGVSLRGWIIPAAAPTDRALILCHGWSDNKGDLLRRFRFLQKDFNLFFFDSRAHGESRAERNTIGYLEAIDFDAALNFLKAEQPEWKRIGVCGLSMGAAMGIFAMARHRGLRCGVFESPFRSFNGVINQFRTNKYGLLPYFPFTWLTLVFIRLRLGDDPEPYSPAYNISRIAPRPVFFIAGEDDRLMPLPDVRALYEEAGEPKELWVIPGAGHAQCQETAGPEYERRVTAFFKENIR